MTLYLKTQSTWLPVVTVASETVPAINCRHSRAIGKVADPGYYL